MGPRVFIVTMSNPSLLEGLRNNEGNVSTLPVYRLSARGAAGALADRSHTPPFGGNLSGPWAGSGVSHEQMMQSMPWCPRRETKPTKEGEESPCVAGK